MGPRPGEFAWLLSIIMILMKIKKIPIKCPNETKGGSSSGEIAWSYYILMEQEEFYKYKIFHW